MCFIIPVTIELGKTFIIVFTKAHSTTIAIQKTINAKTNTTLSHVSGDIMIPSIYRVYIEDIEF
jgi:hypothetical protein